MTRQSTSDAARRLVPPLLILLGLGALQSLMRVGILPSAAALDSTLQAWFREEGLVAVAAISAVENVAIFNFYFPGSLTILVAMASTSGDIQSAIAVFMAIVIPALVVQAVVNYGSVGYIARRMDGWQRYRLLRDMHRLTFRGLLLVFGLFCWHPQFAAAATAACGAARVPARRFLVAFLPPFLVWNLFWGVLMYKRGHGGVVSGPFFGIFTVVVAGWLLIEVVRWVISRRVPLTRSDEGGG